MSTNDSLELSKCPFCGGEAFVRIDVALNPTQARYRVGCDKNPYCHGWYGHSRYYNTETGAAAAWNTRTHGTLTAEQVREAIEENSWKEAFMLREFNESSWQAIADDLNATLGAVSDESSDRPKCDSLTDAVREVKFWCGVNMLRFTYDPEKLVKLFKACCEFENGEKVEG